MKSLIRMLFFLVFVSIVLSCAKPVKASSSINILFIGNSSTYYNNMPTMIKNLARADQFSLNVESITAANYTLKKFSTTSNTYYKKIVNSQILKSMIM